MVDKEHLKAEEQETKETLYGVSQDTIRALEGALEEGEKKQVKQLIKPLHAADVAVVIEYLSPIYAIASLKFYAPILTPIF